MKSFSYCLESGRQWGLDDYYELRSFDGKVAKYWIYDANMYPSNNFSKWSESAKLEVEIHVRERFKDKNVLVILDDYEIDLTLDNLDELKTKLMELQELESSPKEEFDDFDDYIYDDTYECGCCRCCGCDCDIDDLMEMEED